MKRLNSVELEKRLNELERDVIITLSEVVTLNAGMQFVTENDKEANELTDLLEYRNEMTGEVRDFHPISILPDGQIEGYSIEGCKIGGDPINIKQLPLDSKIELIKLIEETNGTV